MDREYLIITYRTDAAKLRAVVPEPLEVDDYEPVVKYEFTRMPDTTGFGDYTESGQVIPASFRGKITTKTTLGSGDACSKAAAAPLAH